jgi:hypothetical protein
MVELPDGRRVTVRLHQNKVDQITIGDTVRFAKPWRKNERVKDIEIVPQAIDRVESVAV